MIKIQLIEDNKIFSDLIKKKLEKSDFQIFQSYSTDAEILEVDLYIMDIKLDSLSFDMMKEVYKRGKPIITFSGHGTEHFMSQAFESGATVFLHKAISPNILVSQIKSLVN